MNNHDEQIPEAQRPEHMTRTECALSAMLEYVELKPEEVDALLKAARDDASELRVLHEQLKDSERMRLDAAGYEPLTFSELRIKNERRDATSFGSALRRWGITHWMSRLTVEVGELASEILALAAFIASNGVLDETEEEHSRSFTFHQGRVMHELADVAIMADLLAQAVGGRLDLAVEQVFNERSLRARSPVRIGMPDADCGCCHDSGQELVVTAANRRASRVPCTNCLAGARAADQQQQKGTHNGQDTDTPSSSGGTGGQPQGDH